MAELFLRVVNMSISANWIVLAVIVLRMILKNVPKWVNPVMWAIVGLRSILPFSIKSVLSLIPSTETISPEVIYTQLPAINRDASAATANLPQIWIFAAAIWILGIAAALLYVIIRYIRLGNRMKTAVLLRDNIYQSEFAASPFVLGVFHPRIYLPFKITDKNMIYVIAHEQAHIKRRDHWIKPIGFLLLCLHWFNPVLWAAYSLFCRDIELACDERVVKQLSGEERADYSEALLSCSAPRKRITSLAFGEIGVRTRVQNVLNYQRPTVWMSIAAVAICTITAVCFLTDPIAPSAETAVEQREAQLLSPPEASAADAAQETDALSEGITVNGFFICTEVVEQALYKYLAVQAAYINYLSENKEIPTQVFLSPEQQTIVYYYITHNENC